MDKNKEEKEPRPWTFKQTKLLIATRLKYEDEVLSGEIKKNSLWYKIWGEIREIDTEFPFTRIEMHRKFNNLLLTYKRIKQRNLEAGRDVTKWEYYKLFHSAYGTKYLNKPVQDLLVSTLESESEDNIPTEENRGLTIVNKNKRPKAQANSNNEMLKFFKKEAVEEERRHQELMKVETERVDLLRSVRDLLDRMLSSGSSPCKRVTEETQSAEEKTESSEIRHAGQPVINQEVAETEKMADVKEEIQISLLSEINETEVQSPKLINMPSPSMTQDTNMNSEIPSTQISEIFKTEETYENSQSSTEESSPEISKRKQSGLLQSSDEEDFAGFGDCNRRRLIRFRIHPHKRVKEGIQWTDEQEEVEMLKIKCVEEHKKDDVPDIKQEASQTEKTGYVQENGHSNSNSN